MLTQTLNQHAPAVNYTPSPRAFEDKTVVRLLRPGRTHLFGRVIGYDRLHDQYEVTVFEVHARAGQTTTSRTIIEFYAATELVADMAA